MRKFVYDFFARIKSKLEEVEDQNANTNLGLYFQDFCELKKIIFKRKIKSKKTSPEKSNNHINNKHSQYNRWERYCRL